MKLFLVLITALFSTRLSAQLITSFVGGDDLSVGPGTAGFAFTTTAPLTLRSLGVYDSDALDAGLWSGHSVGLWDATTHALLASATVPAQGATAIGSFWYVPLALPVTLAAGHSYVLAASYADSDFDLARGNVTSVVTDPRLTMGDALLSTGTGFEFPDLNVSGANRGFLGPNALEAAVPEPSTYAIVASAALFLFAIFRRSRGAAAVLLMLSLPAFADEPRVTPRAVMDAKPAERRHYLSRLSRQRPEAHKIVAALADDPAENNRPPTTPGNTNGRRPTVPPGKRNYGTP